MTRGQGVCKENKCWGQCGERGGEARERGNEGAGKQRSERASGKKARVEKPHRPPTDMGCAGPGRRCREEGP